VKPLNIPIVSGSVRTGRKSLLVARFLRDQFGELGYGEAELIDLADYPFPVFEERPSDSNSLPPSLELFRSKLRVADGILLVSPEYKNGIPGALKNVIDYLDPGAFRHKAVGICTVSAGGFGGIQCMSQLRQLILALGGSPVPEGLPISNVGEYFSNREPLLNNSLLEKTRHFLDELLWYTEALSDKSNACSSRKERWG